MLRVTVRGAGLAPVTLESGERLLFGRAPNADQGTGAAEPSAVALPSCAPHVSRVLGELVVGSEIVKLRWLGATEAQLSSLFDAPAGARRVTVAGSMSALLDEGENHLLLLRGRQAAPGEFTDLLLVIDVSSVRARAGDEQPDVRESAVDRDATATGKAPMLEPGSREWFVALALAEPWLVGSDDYPRPPSNREIFERVRHWHGYAWNLQRPQRVDDAIRTIARLAFGPRDDPFTVKQSGRVLNVRFAVGKRAAELRLVTADDLAAVERAAAGRSAAHGD